MPRTAGAAGALDAALEYRALGWIPLPVAPRSKRPLIARRDLQERMPEAQEVEG